MKLPTLPFGLVIMVLLQGCSSVPRTPAARAAQIEREAADGRVDSALEAARRYETFNDPRAVYWYERAAAVTPRTFDTTRAESALGRIWESGQLLHGDGPDIVQASPLRASPRRAERAYRASAEHGNALAMLELARFHRLQGDARLALRWDLRATVYNHMSSESSRLPQAVAPQHGQEHPLVTDIRARAQAGDVEAQVDLGALFETGIGLERDGVQALQWYQRAGNRGNVYGQYFSGLLLGRGRAGVTRDLDAAAGWFAKAHAQDFHLAGEAIWRKSIEPPFWTFD